MGGGGAKFEQAWRPSRSSLKDTHRPKPYSRDRFHLRPSPVRSKTISRRWARASSAGMASLMEAVLKSVTLSQTTMAMSAPCSAAGSSPPQEIPLTQPVREIIAHEQLHAALRRRHALRSEAKQSIAAPYGMTLRADYRSASCHHRNRQNSLWPTRAHDPVRRRGVDASALPFPHRHALCWQHGLAPGKPTTPWLPRGTPIAKSSCSVCGGAGHCCWIPAADRDERRHVSSIRCSSSVAVDTRDHKSSRSTEQGRQR